MSTHLYVLSVEKPFTELELGEVKEEICRVLQCTEISASGGTQFTVHSRVGPDKLNGLVKILSRMYGVEFKGGAKID
jgi:hypothetical protein